MHINQVFRTAQWAGLSLVLIVASPASAQLAQNSDAPVDITADQLEVVNTQCLATYSGGAEALQDTARLRIPLSMTAFALIATGVAAVRGIRPNRVELLFGGAYGVVSILAALLMYRALDILAPHHRAGVVFPIAVGLSIIGFAVLSHRHSREKRSRNPTLGMALVSIGMISLVAAQL